MTLRRATRNTIFVIMVPIFFIVCLLADLLPIPWDGEDVLKVTDRIAGKMRWWFAEQHERFDAALMGERL